MARCTLKMAVRASDLVIGEVGRAHRVIGAQASEVERMFQVAFKPATDLNETTE